mmetsp:Transcript_92048/g.265653  ORF Transcript_92048/g.265653 Transcript_92048/m.265653 type:complete len:293 (-) Transcript_92048:1833-2711(-)
MSRLPAAARAAPRAPIAPEIRAPCCACQRSPAPWGRCRPPPAPSSASPAPWAPRRAPNAPRASPARRGSTPWSRAHPVVPLAARASSGPWNSCRTSRFTSWTRRTSAPRPAGTAPRVGIRTSRGRRIASVATSGSRPSPMAHNPSRTASARPTSFCLMMHPPAACPASAAWSAWSAATRRTSPPVSGSFRVSSLASGLRGMNPSRCSSAWTPMSARAGPQALAASTPQASSAPVAPPAPFVPATGAWSAMAWRCRSFSSPRCPCSWRAPWWCLYTSPLGPRRSAGTCRKRAS